ncbi:hypothetical protein AGLY_015869 [Aphis glycines]|uniref:Uncharacterized protein n=1 Tax=Aphis glycines TaxID=307491 RepID=A0A6G0T000_APHGL|nr:hypothetical protein AGLY_015869 [Aphis glycines]
MVGYEINGDDNDENKYATGSNSNDNPNSLRLAEIKCTNNKSPQIMIPTPTSRSSLVETPEGLIIPTELGQFTFIRIVNNQREFTQSFDVMESILEKMSSSDLSDSMNKSSTSITDVKSSLPLDNLQNLEMFEVRISEDGAFRINLVNQLSYLGSKHVKSMIKKLMDAVKIQTKFKQVSKNEMEDVIKYILAQAPFNIKRQNEKNVLTL